MKRLLFSLLFIPCLVGAEQTKTVYSPFTGKLDYITKVDSTTVQGSGSITVVTTSSGVTISGGGGGGGGTTIGVEQNQVSVNAAVSTISVNGVIGSTTIAGGRVGMFLRYDPAYFTTSGSSLTVDTNILATAFSVSTNTLSQSSATATYLQNSSATATYLQFSSATATYLQNSSATVTYVQASSATANYVSKSSAAATYWPFPNPTTTNLGEGTNLYLTSARVNMALTNPTTMFIANGTSFQNANFNVNTSSSMRVLTSSLSVVGGAIVSTLTVQPLLDNTTAFAVVNSSGVNVFTITTSTPLAGDAQFGIIIDTRATYAMKIGTATSSGPYLVYVATNGHVNYEGGVNPTISSCGTTPTINPNCTDMGCTVTPGATAGGCTFTFGTPFAKIPNCIVQEQTFSLTNAPSYTVTRTAVTLTETSLTSVVTFLCHGAD